MSELTQKKRNSSETIQAVPTESNQTSNPLTNPEAIIRQRRRRFTAEYKLSILKELDRSGREEGRGAILRREGLYSSQVCEWRQLRSSGALSALSKKRGRPLKASPQEKQIALLKAENKRFQARLLEAEAIIEIQKKVSELLGNRIPRTGSSEESS